MRRTYLLAIVFLCTLNASAQFILGGSIANYRAADRLKINIPQVYGYEQKNDIAIPIDQQGNFRISLPSKEAKFAELIYNRKFYRLLLTPGKDLKIKINGIDSTILVIAGTAAKENKLLQAINLHIEDKVWDLVQRTREHFTSIAYIQQNVMDPILAWGAEKTKKVDASDLPAHLKSLFKAEVKYNTYNNMSGLKMEIKDRKLAGEFYLYLYDPLSPLPDVQPAGLEYYNFVRYYLGYLGPRALANKKAKNIKDNEPLDFYKISADSANMLADKYGNPYLRLILANNMLPSKVAENLTYQEITNLYYNKDMPQLAALLQAFGRTFPTSPYLAEGKDLLAKLKATLEINAKNEKIHILPGYASIKSIQEVVAQLKGKVVYLDIWGTWCGPCKAQIPYLPQLKEQFKGKDIAFVYFDMDEDEQDKTWKEFIKVNGMEGLHFRKNKRDITAFWDELAIKTDDRFYPSYFIFDKTGKLVVSNALRPSDEKELYKQLEKYVK